MVKPIINIPDISAWVDVERLIISGGFTFGTNLIFRVLYPELYLTIFHPDFFFWSHIGVLVLYYSLFTLFRYLSRKIWGLIFLLKRWYKLRKHAPNRR